MGEPSQYSHCTGVSEHKVFSNHASLNTSWLSPVTGLHGCLESLSFLFSAAKPKDSQKLCAIRYSS